MAYIECVKKVLSYDIKIPGYQRPYKWTTGNIDDLLNDIQNAIDDYKRYNKEFKYRIGSCILHRDGEVYNIVDGQQRILSLILINLYLDEKFDCPLLHSRFSNRITQYNIKTNYSYINDWFSVKDNFLKNEFKNAMSEILEFVVISVDDESSAFQFFDSQNSRGKDLYPHDLLKAYHLRQFHEDYSEQKIASVNWDKIGVERLENLFNSYLFPIFNWSRRRKTKKFTKKDISIYKGISNDCPYAYGKKVLSEKQVGEKKYYLITEPFKAGKDFFEMVDVILAEIDFVRRLNIDSLLNVSSEEKSSIGFTHSCNLFYCAVLCYYNRFEELDPFVIRNLLLWSFMLRVDLENLGYDSVNKYSIGENNGKYSNGIPMFENIICARTPNELKKIKINLVRKDDKPAKDLWTNLYRSLKKLGGDV